MRSSLRNSSHRLSRRGQKYSFPPSTNAGASSSVVVLTLSPLSTTCTRRPSRDWWNIGRHYCFSSTAGEVSTTAGTKNSNALLLSQMAHCLQTAPLQSLTLQQFQKAADLILANCNCRRSHHGSVNHTHPSSSSSNDDTIVDDSLRILDRLVREVKANNSNPAYLEISKDILNTCLLRAVIQKWKVAWKNSPHTATEWTSKKLLDRLRKQWNQPEHLQPDIHCYNLLLESYWDMKHLEDPLQAAKQLAWICNDTLSVTDHNTARVQANQKTFELLMQAWIAAKKIPQVLQIMATIRNEHERNLQEQEVLQQQQQQQQQQQRQHHQQQEEPRADLGKNNLHKIRFGPSLFEKALQECVEARAGPWADAILDNMQYFHAHGLLSTQPQIGALTQVIQAWALCTLENAPKRLVELADDIMEHKHLQPDIFTYTVILQGISRLGHMEDAQHILGQLCAQYRQDPHGAVKPDMQLFGTVLDGWARVQHRHDAGHRAETLLRLMWDSHQMVPALKHVVPDVACYTAVMLAFINASSSSTRHGDAAQHAERLFQEMHQKVQEGYSHLQPTSKTYCTLIHAWAHHGHVDQAANILSFALESYQAGTSTVMPDTQCFNSMLNAYAQSKDIMAGLEANRLLNRMWELHADDRFSTFLAIRPNHITYNSVINAWAQSGHCSAGKEAERLMREMMDKAEQLGDDDLKPTNITYNSVINAWGRCDNYVRAREIFVELPSTYPSSSQGDRNQLSRTVDTYNSLLSALASATPSEDQDENFHKGEIADSILLAMEVRDVQPNITTYGLVHKCWHRPTNGTYSFDKAGHRLQNLKDKIVGLEDSENKHRWSVNSGRRSALGATR
jgi:pentatricopeptide repeat protein